MFWSFIGMNLATTALFRSLALTVGQSLIGLLLTAAGGAMPNMFLWPRATIDYYLFNAAALFTGRLPWPLFDNSHWTDWPVGLTDFIAILAMSILGALWSQRGREPVILALSLLSLSYLFVCVVMINMPESDKLLPTLTFGIYAYARWCAFESRPCTESGRTRAGITG
jgi:hypothetical protein